jgi:hypothetical protein
MADDIELHPPGTGNRRSTPPVAITLRIVALDPGGCQAVAGGPPPVPPLVGALPQQGS